MDGQVASTTNDELSDKQWMVLIVLQICSASLSLVGSCTIVFKILQDLAQNRLMVPYDRFILGLSSCDVLASITLVINPFLVPSETGEVWAFGSPATCQTAGFLNQFSITWAGWYNCLLSYYFLLTVLSQVRLKNFVRKYELWMHLSGIYFLITAILGYHHGWYDELDLGSACWVTDEKIKWIFGGIVRLFTYFSLIINNIVIYVVLRKSLRMSVNVAGPMLAQKRLMREATTLMFLYIAFFFVTTLPHFILEILKVYFGYTKDNAGKIYAWMVLSAILYPLQGFFNVFIYLMPAYTRFRTANPNKPMYLILHQALFNPDVPQLTFSGDQPPSDAILEEETANPNQALFSSNFRPYSSSSNSSSSSDSSEQSSNASQRGQMPVIHVKMPRKKSEDAEEDESS